MTRLTKPIRRRTTLITDYRKSARPIDDVTVTLYPDGTIGFRANRRRTEYTMPLSACYMLAMRHEEQEKAKAKAKSKKEGKRS